MSRGFFEDRLLTFEVCGAVYALPIEDVLEVAEVGRIFFIPTLPLEIGGVVNHHGDALPVMNRSMLFDGATSDSCPPKHLLVLTQREGDPTGSFGLPVDRVVGIAAGRGGVARDDWGVVERRPIDGRVVSILDTRRLLDRAAEAVERATELPVS